MKVEKNIPGRGWGSGGKEGFRKQARVEDRKRERERCKKVRAQRKKISCGRIYEKMKNRKKEEVEEEKR